MKYKVITRCHGFRKRLWEVGQIVEIDPSENPPHHFVPIEDKDVPKVEIKKDQMSLAEIGKPPEVVGGMGSSLPKPIDPFKRKPGRPKK